MIPEVFGYTNETDKKYCYNQKNWNKLSVYTYETAEKYYYYNITNWLISLLDTS